MNNNSELPTSKNDAWQGRIDNVDGDLGARAHQVVKDFKPEPGICLIGLASDLGVKYNQGRIGADAGPTYFRKAFANIAWHFQVPLFDLGDVAVATKQTVEAQAAEPLAVAQTDYAKAATRALNAKQFLIGIGGGHEIGWASYSACRQYLDLIKAYDKTVAIINFDAHFDLRKAAPSASWAGSSGTPFHQVASHCESRELEFQYACIGINDSANTPALFNYAHAKQVSYLLDRDCNSENVNALINKFIKRADYLYVTICLDSLPASVAPGVSAPAALGISLELIIQSLAQIKQACKANNTPWLMADIAELNPTYDIDQRTAKVAARLAYELVRLQLTPSRTSET